jgi:hypothetical protein
MTRRDETGGRSQSAPLGRDPDGMVRLVVDGDHLEHAPEGASHVPGTGNDREAPSRDPDVSERPRSAEEDRLIAANRERIAELHQLRTTSPVDFSDVFWGGLWVLVIVVPVVVAGSVFARVGVLWAAVISILSVFVTLCFVASSLERRNREAARKNENGIVPAPSQEAHWRMVTPAHLLRRITASLDRVNVDDTELEAEQEQLYEHGNKTDNGFGRWR